MNEEAVMTEGSTPVNERGGGAAADGRRPETSSDGEEDMERKARWSQRPHHEWNACEGEDRRGNGPSLPRSRLPRRGS